jgi:hypothetical protein
MNMNSVRDVFDGVIMMQRAARAPEDIAVFVMSAAQSFGLGAVILEDRDVEIHLGFPDGATISFDGARWHYARPSSRSV